MKKTCIYINELGAIRSDGILKVTLCCCLFPCTVDYEEVIQHLHIQERNYYNTLKFGKRMKSYLLGRFVAKKAVAALTGEKQLTNIYIQSGIFTQPIVVSDTPNIQVSITHCDDFGAAIAFPEAHPMGIDIERINPQKTDILKRLITEAEEKLIHSSALSYELGVILLWTAKEALSKVLKTGLMTPFEVFEVSKIERYEEYITCYYKNFSQYKATAFRIADYMCSVAYPLRSELCFDIKSLNANFSQLEIVQRLLGT